MPDEVVCAEISGGGVSVDGSGGGGPETRLNFIEWIADHKFLPAGSSGCVLL
jgi:hypothetical protein